MGTGGMTICRGFHTGPSSQPFLTPSHQRLPHRNTSETTYACWLMKPAEEKFQIRFPCDEMIIDSSNVKSWLVQCLSGERPSQSIMAQLHRQHRGRFTETHPRAALDQQTRSLTLSEKRTRWWR